MNLRKLLFSLLAFTMLTTSCSSYKKSLYMQNDAVYNKEAVSQLYDFRIMPKDELTIIVSTSDPAASAPFYRKFGQAKEYYNANTAGLNDGKLLAYLVDNEGFIDYPILGKLKVIGMTTRECEALICEHLKPYLNEVPNVSVRNANYKYSVLGEVTRPGTYTAPNEKISIFEALAQAGDMTLFSVREDVQLLRENAEGKREIIHVDLTQADIANSPYYYLQQNDVIYVKPKKSRVGTKTFAENAQIWISVLGLMTSITSLIIVSSK